MLRLVALASVRTFPGESTTSSGETGTLWGGGARLGEERFRLVAWSLDTLIERGTVIAHAGERVTASEITSFTIGGALLAYYSFGRRVHGAPRCGPPRGAHRGRVAHDRALGVASRSLDVDAAWRIVRARGFRRRRIRFLPGFRRRGERVLAQRPTRRRNGAVTGWRGSMAAEVAKSADSLWNRCVTSASDRLGSRRR